MRNTRVEKLAVPEMNRRYPAELHAYLSFALAAAIVKLPRNDAQDPSGQDPTSCGLKLPEQQVGGQFPITASALSGILDYFRVVHHPGAIADMSQ